MSAALVEPSGQGSPAAEAPHDAASPQPTVSFIVPAYNAESTLERSVHSILRQTGAPFDVTIVDDGSTDATPNIAQALAEADERVSWFSQPNAGAAAALNAGRQKAKAKLVASVDADDELAEDYLSTMSAFVAKYPDYDFYSHDLWRVGKDGITSRMFHSHGLMSLDLDEFLQRPMVIGPGTIWRREVLERLNGYPEGEYNEDYDLWLRALASGARHIHCPRPLYFYHQHESQKSADRYRVHQSMVRMFERFAEEFELTPSQSAAVDKQLLDSREILRDFVRYGAPEATVLTEASDAGAARLRHLVESIVPQRAVEPTLGLIHRVTWVIRPARIIMWKLGAWIRKRANRRV